MRNRVLVSVQENVCEPVWFEKVEPFLQMIMEKLSFNEEEVSVMFCNDEFIQELNKNYRNIDAPTDVLSFENDEEYTDDEGKWKCAGDIVISLETLPRNAAYFEVDEMTELRRLLIHGLLHLNGYDHGEEHIEKGVAPVCEMLQIQEKILNELKF